MVVAGDGFVCVSYYVQQWCRICGRSVDDRNLRALFTHMDYRDKLPDRLSALDGVPINREDLLEFVYRQCAFR